MENLSYRAGMGLGLNISKGKVATAKKVVIYGPEGIGKSTLAARFPAPLFLDVEGSTKALVVDRVSEIPDWKTLRSILIQLYNANTEYKTVVIDTADWAEKLCVTDVCITNKKQGIEDFGYGKGYVYVKEEFAKLLVECDSLIRKGVNVVFTAHAMMRKFEQPDERGAYDRWELKLSKHNAPVLKEWADMVLFCNYKTYTEQQENGKYKVSGGRRVIYATHNPCWDAKNRYGLPDEMDMDYKAIKEVIEDHDSQTAAAPMSVMCADCGQEITAAGKWSADQIVAASVKKYGQALCMACAKKRKGE